MRRPTPPGVRRADGRTSAPPASAATDLSEESRWPIRGVRSTARSAAPTPSERRARAVDFEPQIVLVARAHLTDVHGPFRAPVEPDEQRREILALHRERFAAIAGSLR